MASDVINPTALTVEPSRNSLDAIARPGQPTPTDGKDFAHNGQALPRVDEQTPVSRAELRVAADEVKERIQELSHRLSFSVDEDSGRTVIKVMDSQSKEVIKQIPSESILKLAQHLRDKVENVDEKLGVLLEIEA